MACQRGISRNQSQEIIANKYYYAGVYTFICIAPERVSKVENYYFAIVVVVGEAKKDSLKVTVIEIGADNRSSIPRAEMELMDEIDGGAMLSLGSSWIALYRYHNAMLLPIRFPLSWHWLSSS